MSTTCLDTTFLKNKYKNQTNCKKIIDKIKEKYMIENKHFFDEEIIKILYHHPLEKCKNRIISLVYKKDRYGGLTLHYKDIANDEYTSVSLNQCIKSLFGKSINHIEDVKSAMRIAIWGEGLKLTTYRIENKNKPNECGHFDDSHIDHYPVSFQKILDDFVRINNLKLEEVKIYKEGIQYYLKDKKLKDKWVEYHESKANFRKICKKCNISLGTHGY